MYDIAIIGGGIGGYTAAIKAAKNGLKVALFEKGKIGGTCLHEGCIPTKTFLQLSNKYQDIQKLKKMGFSHFQRPNIEELNWEQFLSYKNQTISQLFTGLQYLVQKNKIDFFPEKVDSIVKKEFFDVLSKKTTISAKEIIMATGSVPFVPNKVNEVFEKVLSSDQLLELKELPTSIAIIGSGVIGIEFATFFSQLGIPVSIIEKEQYILPTIDRDISNKLKEKLIKNGVNFKMGYEVDFNSFVESAENVRFTTTKDGIANEESAQYVLVAIGRKRFNGDLLLEQMDLNKDQLEVNEHLETTQKGLYVIGDASGNIQLAHAASHQAEIVIERILGNKEVKYDEFYVPKCIYSYPEVSSIGLTEEEAKKDYNVKVGRFQLSGNGKSVITGETDGFIKVVVDEKTDRILGVHIIGDKATELISEASLALLVEATSMEIGFTIHPHPTVSEIFNEAALAVNGQEIHS
ncbi:dihydrolipoyl dehydrogenase [Ureibacillus massiliensis]|uniref:dihydrolipoyl dehydrogenase n=1 Tax=Ureibacillus massiliensis TaxID=292806 RepID=UPI00068A5AE7|nr:dihydrolipoyl dehydrogenase [Ureibacillus massiliensis]